MPWGKTKIRVPDDLVEWYPQDRFFQLLGLATQKATFYCFYKAYPRMANTYPRRSIYYHDSSVRCTITFGTVTFGILEDTSSNLASNIYFWKCVFYSTCLPGSQHLDLSLGRHVPLYTETRQMIRPKDAAVPGGGGVLRLTMSWEIEKIFHPSLSLSR